MTCAVVEVKVQSLENDIGLKNSTGAKLTQCHPRRQHASAMFSRAYKASIYRSERILIQCKHRRNTEKVLNCKLIITVFEKP